MKKRLFIIIVNIVLCLFLVSCTSNKNEQLGEVVTNEEIRDVLSSNGESACEVTYTIGDMINLLKDFNNIYSIYLIEFKQIDYYICLYKDVNYGVIDPDGRVDYTNTDIYEWVKYVDINDVEEYRNNKKVQRIYANYSMKIVKDLMSNEVINKDLEYYGLLTFSDETWSSNIIIGYYLLFLQKESLQKQYIQGRFLINFITLIDHNEMAYALLNENDTFYLVLNKYRKHSNGKTENLLKKRAREYFDIIDEYSICDDSLSTYDYSNNYINKTERVKLNLDLFIEIIKGNLK